MIYWVGIAFLLLSGATTVYSFVDPKVAYIGWSATIIYFWFGMTFITDYYKLEVEKFRKEWMNCGSMDN